MRVRACWTGWLWLVGAATLAMPAEGIADPRPSGRDRWRWDGPSRSSSRGYAMLKGGGMMLGAGGSAGGYFGLEAGQNAADRLDFGFSIDWYHRHRRDLELLFETDRGFDPPLRGEVTRFESSSDFVPIGLTLRLRLPLERESIVPFVSGTLAYEVLHVEFFDRDRTPGTWDEVLGESQTLMGFGWQAAGGVEIALAPGFGVFGEAGLHRSDPSRQIDFGSLRPVDVSASLHGGFLRAGFRVAL